MEHCRRIKRRGQRAGRKAGVLAIEGAWKRCVALISYEPEAMEAMVMRFSQPMCTNEAIRICYEHLYLADQRRMHDKQEE